MKLGQILEIASSKYRKQQQQKQNHRNKNETFTRMTPQGRKKGGKTLEGKVDWAGWGA